MTGRRSQRGGALLWTVVALMLMSIGLVMVTQTYIRTSTAQRANVERLAALGIAEREMERLKAMPFAALPAPGRSATAWAGLAQLPQGRAALEVAPAAVAGMRRLTVRVEWQSPQGPARRVELVAVRGPRGGP